MGLANFRKGSIFGKTEDIEEYKSLKDLEVNKDYKFTSFFFNSKAEYPHYVLQYKNIGYSLPTHMNTTFSDISKDAGAIKEIKAGLAYFTVYEYEKTIKKKSKKFRSINVGILDEASDDEYENVSDGELPFD